MADIDFEEVQLGTAPTGVGGDVPRTAFSKITNNFNKIKAFFADSSNAASRKVGKDSGDVMEVGAFGLGGKAEGLASLNDIPPINHFGEISGNTEGEFPVNAGAYISLQRSTTNDGWLLQGARNSDRWFLARHAASEIGDVVEITHTGNTTIDSNGFIKEASPIIKLFDDKIEKTHHLEIQSAELEKLGIGHYKITGVPELSRDGWYIETPKDRNNNIYFTLDYEELDGELIIKTYEPDYSSGRAENGAPMDILEGRFVSLRFAEDPSLYPEPEDE